MQFASYLIKSLREAPLIRHMGPHVRRLWSAIAIQDVLNYAGSWIYPQDLEKAQQQQQTAAINSSFVQQDQSQVSQDQQQLVLPPATQEEQEEKDIFDISDIV